MSRGRMTQMVDNRMTGGREDTIQPGHMDTAASGSDEGDWLEPVDIKKKPDKVRDETETFQVEMIEAHLAHLNTQIKVNHCLEAKSSHEKTQFLELLVRIINLI